MHLRTLLLSMAVMFTLVLAACAPAAQTMSDSAEETMAEETMAEEAMATEEPAMDEEAMDEEEMADEDMSDEEMTDEDMTDEDMDDGEMADDEMASDEMMMGGHVTLDISGLESLGEGYAYEGWLIIDGAPVSTGVFHVDENGMSSGMDFMPEMMDADAVDVSAATAFVLTIEPVPDDDPAPSAVHLLGGDIVDGVAELSVAHPAALNADFGAIDSTYIIGIGALASATAENTYHNGIWFDKLSLPLLPEGWIYEGWVVGPDGPITTGRFADPNAMDEDGSGPFAGGPGTGPNFPGQDFLTPPTDLTSGYAAVISIEPVPDNSPAPFTLKPLVDEMVEDVGDHGSQAFGSNLGSYPAGTATIVVQ